jgi:hypothetical protein
MKTQSASKVFVVLNPLLEVPSNPTGSPEALKRSHRDEQSHRDSLDGCLSLFADEQLQ